MYSNWRCLIVTCCLNVSSISIGRVCKAKGTATKTKTQLDETRIGLTKLWATAWSINIFICDGGQTNGQRERQTSGQTGGQGRRTDDETAVQCFRKVLGQTAVAVAVAPGCSSRLAARWVRVCLSLCLSVHPACGILNFWTWPTAVRRLWGETWDRRLGTGDCRLQTWRPETGDQRARL